MSRFGDFDFGELKDLKQSLNKMGQAYPRFVEECVRELAARLLAKTIARTPVDSGELRRGWTVGQIQRQGDAYEVEVINPVEYAKYVEYGHRTRNHEGWVEGRFMLTISEEELQREMPEILERKLKQFMKKYMG